VLPRLQEQLKASPPERFLLMLLVLNYGVKHFEAAIPYLILLKDTVLNKE